MATAKAIVRAVAAGIVTIKSAVLDAVELIVPSGLIDPIDLCALNVIVTIASVATKAKQSPLS